MFDKSSRYTSNSFRAHKDTTKESLGRYKATSKILI